jgi:hypothetical protein
MIQFGWGVAETILAFTLLHGAKKVKNLKWSKLIPTTYTHKWCKLFFWKVGNMNEYNCCIPYFRVFLLDLHSAKYPVIILMFRIWGYCNFLEMCTLHMYL